MDDNKYTITKYSSETIEVTKEQYISHLEQKLMSRFDDYQNARLKFIKAENEMFKKSEKHDEVVKELQELMGYNKGMKAQEYVVWAYKERNPKKYQILKDNPV